MSDDFYDEKGPITLTDKQQAEFWETQARGLTKVADEYLGIIKKNGVKIKELEAQAIGAHAANAILEAKLEERSKQIGVACLEHDLVHSLKCGRCYEIMEEKLKGVIELAAHYIPHSEEVIKSLIADYKLGKDQLKVMLDCLERIRIDKEALKKISEGV